MHYTIDEQDSDEFPLNCELENFEDLLQSIKLLLGFKRDMKMLSIVLEASEVIVSIDKLSDRADYRVTKKVKEQFIRVFLSKMP